MNIMKMEMMRFPLTFLAYVRPYHVIRMGASSQSLPRIDRDDGREVKLVSKTKRTDVFSSL